MIAPEWVAVSGFGRKRSLSDLAVWGFPETFPENLPPQALPHPFHPLFSPSTSSFNSSTLQNPLFTSLDRAFSPFLPLLPSFYPFEPFLPPSSLFLGPYRILSEHLRNPSVGSPKGSKRPFLGLLGVFPQNPPKGPKYPFLGPF